ncbi:MAG: 30S ribosomal protein S20 [Thermoleophilia bacterium]|nr:30S ribosomal protein S20 [Thermoleophilia bacterium]
MANIKQQKKRILTAQRQRLENLRYRSAAKTMMRQLQDAVNLGEKETAAKTALGLQTLLDRAVARNVMHKNTASRRKARAARLLVSEPVHDEATVRRAKLHLKKTAAPKKKVAAKAPTAAQKAKAEKAATAAAKATAEATAADDATAAATEAKADDATPEAAADEATGAEATEEAPVEDAADVAADDAK